MSEFQYYNPIHNKIDLEQLKNAKNSDSLNTILSAIHHETSYVHTHIDLLTQDPNIEKTIWGNLWEDNSKSGKTTAHLLSERLLHAMEIITIAGQYIEYITQNDNQED